MALLAHCRENTAFYSELANVGGSEVFVVGYEDYRAICGALDGFEPKKASEALKKTEEQFGLTLNYASGFDLLFLISLCIMRTGENIEAVSYTHLSLEFGAAHGYKSVCKLHKIGYER